MILLRFAMYLFLYVFAVLSAIKGNYEIGLLAVIAAELINISENLFPRTP